MVKLINHLEISQRYPTLWKPNLHEVISLYITTNMSSRNLSMTYQTWNSDYYIKRIYIIKWIYIAKHIRIITCYKRIS